MAINETAPRILAEEALALNPLVVHCSFTDYVFNGEKQQPWVETDEPNPLNVYGEQSLQESVPWRKWVGVSHLSH